MIVTESLKSLCWLIHKDCLREIHAPNLWLSTLLLGLVLVCLLTMGIDLPANQRAPVVAALLWTAVVFAGTIAMDRSFSDERIADCWQALVLYPVAPSVLFLGKLASNIISLTFLECVVIPLFIVLSDAPLLARPSALILIAALSNVGFAAVGTLIGGITATLQNRGALAALLLLPLVLPALLASAAATAALIAGEIDQAWWRWIQLLAVFALLFTVLGALVFEFVVEE